MPASGHLDVGFQEVDCKACVKCMAPQCLSSWCAKQIAPQALQADKIAGGQL